MDHLTADGLSRICDSRQPRDGIYESKEKEQIEAVLQRGGSRSYKAQSR